MADPTTTTPPEPQTTTPPTTTPPTNSPPPVPPTTLTDPAAQTSTGSPPAGGPDGQGGAGPTSETSWLSALPEDLRGNERLAGFKSPEELARAYATAKLAAEVPAAEAYKLPEGIAVKDIGKWANEAGLSQAQLDKVLALDQQVRTQNEQAVEQSNKAGLEQLFQSWGQEKDTNIRLAKQAVAFFDSEDKELANFLNLTRAGNHPVVVRYFARMGQRLLKEDVFVPNGDLKGRTGQPKTAAETIFDGK